MSPGKTGQRNSAKGESEPLPKSPKSPRSSKSPKDTELKKSTNFFLASPREKFHKPKDLPEAPYLCGEFKCKGTKRWLALEEGKFLVYAKKGSARLLDPFVSDVTLEQNNNILIFTDAQGVMQFEAKKAKLVAEFVNLAQTHLTYLNKNPTALIRSPSQRLRARVSNKRKESKANREGDKPLVPSPKISRSPSSKRHKATSSEESWGTASEGSVHSTSDSESTPPSSSYETRTEDIRGSSDSSNSSSESS